MDGVLVEFLWFLWSSVIFWVDSPARSHEPIVNKFVVYPHVYGHIYWINPLFCVGSRVSVTIWCD